jgi:hypothetical protein
MLAVLCPVDLDDADAVAAWVDGVTEQQLQELVASFDRQRAALLAADRLKRAFWSLTGGSR